MTFVFAVAAVAARAAATVAITSAVRHRLTVMVPPPSGIVARRKQEPKPGLPARRISVGPCASLPPGATIGAAPSSASGSPPSSSSSGCGPPPPASSSTTSTCRGRSPSGPTTCSRSVPGSSRATPPASSSRSRTAACSTPPTARRSRRSVAEIKKSPEVLAVGDPFAEGAPVSKDGKITFAQIQFRKGAGDVDRRAGQDDGRGHARARRQGRRPGRARRRHHPLVDGRAGRRRRDLRHPRRGARAVPDARRGRDGAAAAQRAVRDGREPRR